MSEDLSSLNAAQRATLASDPSTDPAILIELGKDWHLVTEVAANPSTPDGTRFAIYLDFPHLRPKTVPIPDGSARHPSRSPAVQSKTDAMADDAIARFRARSEDQARNSDAMNRMPANAHRNLPSTVQVRDVSGRTVQVPTAQLMNRGTNGMAVAALVMGLIGGSVLAIVFGHVAKSQIARTGESGEGMASWGQALGYLQMAALLIFFLFVKSQVG
ncbi:MAG: DUF4190 domain-containing protein [Cellulomonas sp.]